MKKISILILGIWIAVYFNSCKDPFENEVFSAYDEEPVGALIKSWEQFSDWVTLLEKADLYNAINVGDNFTCFVADNDAVSAFLREQGYSSIDDFSEEMAIELMRYHIISGVKYEFANFTGKLDNSTLSGDNLTIKADGETYLINDEARIIDRQYDAINGKVYRLDRVLTPIFETVWDKINKEERYSIFRDALELCGLHDTLAVKERFYGEEALRDYKTVFIVSDSIFKENGINSLEDLKSIYSITPDETGVSPLFRYMAYHIVPEFSDWATLGVFHSRNPQKTKVLQTFAPNEIISLADISGEILLNREHEAIKLITGHYDILGNNGYIHEVDGLLPVVKPQATFFSFEFSDYDCFKVHPLYKKWSNDVDQTTHDIDLTYETGIRWKTVPVRNDVMKYYLRSNQGFIDNEAAALYLGSVGWMEFDIPVIPAGNYEMRGQCQRYNGRGAGRAYFDGDFKQLIDLSSGGAQYSGFKICDIEIKEQTSHVFKVVATRSGQMDYDMIYFIPN